MRPLAMHPLVQRLLLFSTLLFCGSLSMAQQAPVILVMGDSLSAGYGIDVQEGWVTLLEERLSEQGFPHQVVNGSVSGETSGGGLNRLPRLLEQHEPSWVILELGGNDGLRGYPVSDLRGNLEEIVAMSRDSGADVLLLGMQIPPNYGPRYTRQFAEVYPALAEELDLALVPFMLEGVATDSTLMQRDGIHPNADAQPLILETVWPVLHPQLKALGSQRQTD
ncbi:arylesterase [Marinimicrobium sp. ARAG 43.8]|uniref:arylesterase n=1 Tax=Marinimicrobium sp. ARAG 43.8 TaxID=3418719 RepID=UPI003CF866EA